MDTIVIFTIFVVLAVCVQMAVFYIKFKWGLVTKMFGLVSCIGGVAAILAFILGHEGLTFKLFSTVAGPTMVLVIVIVVVFYRSIVTPLQTAMASLTSSTSQISSTAKQSAATATQQASTVAEVSTTVEEINQTSKSASDNAQQVVRVAEEAVEGGRAGQNAINKAVAVMQSIHDQVKGVTEQIMRLNERNEQIVNIVESVNELAEQSNLLAVNASIEAAKAGEHGRGFSVVASEVRDLAKQSKAATQQIRSLLSEIEKESGRAVTGTNEALERTKAGQSEIESVREVLQSLASVLDLTADKARQIFGSTAQQAAGIEQISDAMENVAQGGEDSASGARQLEEAVHGLSLLAKQLNRTIHGSAKDE